MNFKTLDPENERPIESFDTEHILTHTDISSKTVIKPTIAWFKGYQAMLANHC